MKRVYGACVFKNSLTRFVNGYRFKLGAEVGFLSGHFYAHSSVGEA